MSDIPTSYFQSRLNDDGFYRTMSDTLTSVQNEKSYLATGNVTLDEDYMCVWDGVTEEDQWSRTSLAWKADPTAAFRTIIIGQIGNKASGTRMGFAGNGYIKKNKQKFEENATIRNVFHLECPNLAPTVVQAGWDNQIAEIDKLTEAIGDKMNINDTTIRGILSATSAEDTAIKVVSKPIYVKPSNSYQSGGVFKKTAKVNLASLNSNVVRPAVQPIVHETIASGKMYPCRTFPDYDPSLFHDTALQVLQHEIYDINDQLVAPWDIHNILKPGVVALFDGVFNAWRPPKTNPTLQFVADNIRVVADSPFEAEKPDIPRVNVSPIEPESTSRPAKRVFPFGNVDRQMTTHETDHVSHDETESAISNVVADSNVRHTSSPVDNTNQPDTDEEPARKRTRAGKIKASK